MELKIFRQKNFGLKKRLGLKNFGSEKVVGSRKFLGLWSEKNGSLKVWSNNIFVHKNYDPQKLGTKSLVKIGPVTAEILLIWTNAARAHVAWTNVTITVGIF